MHKGQPTHPQLAPDNRPVDFAPSLLLFVCMQCDAHYQSLLYRAASGFEVATFAAQAGSSATPKTPRAVAFYLDQAHRARNVGANSAAAAMYRVALDALLQDQGFEGRMCGQKLGDLERKMAAGTAPAWTSRVSPSLLDILKRLGDGALHTNNGDITRQEVLDRKLVDSVSLAMHVLLEKVYEQPAREVDHEAELAAAVKALEESPATLESASTDLQDEPEAKA
jgi:hypothetical protein